MLARARLRTNFSLRSQSSLKAALRTFSSFVCSTGFSRGSACRIQKSCTTNTSRRLNPWRSSGESLGVRTGFPKVLCGSPAAQLRRPLVELLHVAVDEAPHPQIIPAFFRFLIDGPDALHDEVDLRQVEEIEVGGGNLLDGVSEPHLAVSFGSGVCQRRFELLPWRSRGGWAEREKNAL